MWKCHKCGKPVYFAERKQSLGYDWHPECLRCEECGKRLNPGQHAEHKGVPYCHVPCYGALFGPQLFGHGTRVESHTSFGKVENRCGGPNMPRSHLESKLKLFNQFYDGKSGEIRSREVNGRLVLEGALRIHWGVLGMIHLKEDDDQRTVVTIRKRNSCRNSLFNGVDFEVMGVCSASSDGSSCVHDLQSSPGDESPEVPSNASQCSVLSDLELPKSHTLPPKLDVKQINWDELDELLQVERVVNETDKLYQTMPIALPLKSSSDFSPLSSSEEICNNNTIKDSSPEVQGEKNCNGIANNQEQKSNQLIDFVSVGDKSFSRSMSGPDSFISYHERSFINDDGPDDDISDDEGSFEFEASLRGEGEEEDVSVRRAAKTGAAAIRRRSGKRRSRTKLKRRCSINGHFYNRETSFFTPPHGSQMSVWVTSLVNTGEVINLLLEKYKVDNRPDNFALFVIRDNGEQRRLREDEYPLLVRVMLGPHEDVAKLFLTDGRTTEEISSEVAQFLNLSLAECRAILLRYREEEEREAKRIRSRFREMRKRIKQRMEDLKVRL